MQEFFLLRVSRVVRVIFCRPKVVHTAAVYSIPQRFVGRDCFSSERCHPCGKIHTELRRFVDPPVRGTSLMKFTPPGQGHHMALGTGLLQGPTGGLFLMSQVPL